VAVSANLSVVQPNAVVIPVRIDADLRGRLQHLAVRTGRSPSRLIGDALAEYLDRRGSAALPSWVGAAGRPGQPVRRSG
jgi:predicted transcriptional regulator